MTPFLTCAAGHDLTEEGAYYYKFGGSRECRKCAKGNKKK